jgi:hypothetical protein
MRDNDRPRMIRRASYGSRPSVLRTWVWRKGLVSVGLSLLLTSSSMLPARSYSTTPASSRTRSATMPASHSQNDLVRTPSPIDNASDLLINGNVAAGKQFRGSIPYYPITRINTELGSTSLDTFLKTTAGSQDAREPLSVYRPFYSPTATVAGAQPSGQTYTSSNTVRQQGGMPSDYAFSALPSVQGTTSDADSSANDPILQVWRQLPTRPVSQMRDTRRQADTEDSSEPLENLQDPLRRSTVPASSENRRLLEEIQHRLDGIRDAAAALEKQEQEEIAQQPDATLPTNAPDTSDGTDTDFRLQVYDPLRSSPDGLLSESTGQDREWINPSVSGGKPTASGPDEVDDLSAVQSVTERIRGFDGPSAFLRQPTTDASAWRKAPPDATSSERTAVGRLDSMGSALSEMDSASRKAAGATRNPNVDITPSAQAAFDRNLQAGQLYLRQGQYSRAADAFTLASAYRPADARAWLGKGHVSFAAGDYTASASALARAIELDPNTSLKKADLVMIAGGPDEFIARFNDLDRHVQVDPTWEQYFLLAYVYYQMDQAEQAKTAIEAARKRWTSSASVKILAAAINR